MKASIIFLFLFFALAYAKVTLGRNDMTRVGHGAFKRSSQQGQAQSQSDGDSDTMHQRQSQDLESHSQGSIERTNQGSQCNNKCPAKELMQPCTCYEVNNCFFKY